MKKNVIFNYNLEKYKKKYRNKRDKLLSYSKQEVGNFNKFNNNKIDKEFLLNGHKWALIGDTYYEIPKAPRWTWFRNLNAGVQTSVILLVSIGLASAVVFPTLFATIWKPITAGVSEKLKEDVKVETKEKLVIGESATIELTINDKAKETKQLPSDPKQITVTTGGVKLDYWPKTSNFANTVSNNKCVSYSNSLSANDTETEPDNYFKYTYTKDKADIWIKKILGPVEIDMVLEDRTYTVTFDPNNGEDKTFVNVKKGNKVSKPTDPTKEFCKLHYWGIGESTDAFDFDTAINQDYNLKAHYVASETVVVIKGINGLANHYSSMQEAYDAGNAVMKGINTDLYWGTCTKEKYLETFNDVTVDEQGYYKANITWELYTKEGEELVIPANKSELFYSFGRGTNSFGEGDEDKLFIYNTKVIGADVDNKAKLKYESSSNSCRIMSANTIHTNNRLENPFTFKNISFDDSLVSTYIIYQASSPMDYYLTVDGCDFVNRLCVDGTNKTLVVKNCTFDGTNSSNAYGLELWDGNGEEKSDTLIFENNIVKNYSRGLQLNDAKLGHASIKGNTFKNMNASKVKLANGAVQLSAGTNSTYDIVGNTFDHCYTNCFKIHENFTGHATVNINENIIKDCGYVGLSENDKTLGYYTLNSKDNVINNTAKDKAGNGTSTETTDLNFIVVLNEK